MINTQSVLDLAEKATGEQLKQAQSEIAALPAFQIRNNEHIQKAQQTVNFAIDLQALAKLMHTSFNIAVVMMQEQIDNCDYNQPAIARAAHMQETLNALN